MQNGVIPALIMSTFAGLSTCIGSLIAIFAKKTDFRLLSFALGFSAGVMILVSFSELLPESRHNLSQSLGDKYGGLTAAVCLLCGFALSIIIDRLVPAYNKYPVSGKNKLNSSSLARMGLVTAIAMTLHNFPEGIATFMAGYSNFRLGLPITLSISMHNIPEGIAVSIPVFFGTGSRLRAFGISALSGLSEPLGALMAYFVLAPFLSSTTLGIIFAAVAGIMIYLSFDEIIPASERCGHSGLSLCGIFTGIGVMWLVLTVFKL